MAAARASCSRLVAAKKRSVSPSGGMLCSGAALLRRSSASSADHRPHAGIDRAHVPAPSSRADRTPSPLHARHIPRGSAAPAHSSPRCAARTTAAAPAPPAAPGAAGRRAPHPALRRSAWHATARTPAALPVAACCSAAPDRPAARQRQMLPRRAATRRATASVRRTAPAAPASCSTGRPARTTVCLRNCWYSKALRWLSVTTGASSAMLCAHSFSVTICGSSKAGRCASAHQRLRQRLRNMEVGQQDGDAAQVGKCGACAVRMRRAMRSKEQTACARRSPLQADLSLSFTLSHSSASAGASFFSTMGFHCLASSAFSAMNWC